MINVFRVSNEKLYGRGMYVGNASVEDKTEDTYTWMPGGRDGVESKNVIDLVLVKKNMMKYLYIVRGYGMGLSDHSVVLLKVRLWRHRLKLGGYEWISNDHERKTILRLLL